MNYPRSIYSHLNHDIRDYLCNFRDDMNMIMPIDMAWSSFKNPNKLFNLFFKL